MSPTSPIGLDRTAQVILLDAFAPNDGESVLDYAGAERKAELTVAAQRDPSFNLAPLPAAALGVMNLNDADWLNRRMTPHPVGTHIKPIKFMRGLAPITLKTYIGRDEAKLAVFDNAKARIRYSADQQYLSLRTSHDAMITLPALLAEALVKVAAQ